MSKRMLISLSFLLQPLLCGQAISQNEATYSFDRQILGFAAKQTQIRELSEKGKLDLNELSRRFPLTRIVERDSKAVPEIRSTLTRVVGEAEVSRIVKEYLTQRISQENLNGFFGSPDVLRICGFEIENIVAMAKLNEFAERLDSEFFAKRKAELHSQLTELFSIKLNAEQRKISNSLLGLGKNSLEAGRVTKLFKSKFPLSSLAIGTSVEASLDCGLSKEQAAKLQQLSKQTSEKISSEMLRPNSNSAAINGVLDSIEADMEDLLSKLLTLEQLDRLMITEIHETVELNGIAEFFRWNEVATEIGLTQAECDELLAAAKVLDESRTKLLASLRSQQFSQVLQELSNEQRAKLTAALYSPLEL